jgi:hypothetical protein
MLSVTWHKALELFLVVAPHVLLGVLAVVLWTRRLYREFPCFFAYLLYEVVTFVLLFALYSLGAAKEYAHAYYPSQILSVVLRFGVIDEVSRALFRESRLLRVSIRRSLQCVTGLLVVTGVVLAVYAPGDNSVWWLADVDVVNRGAAMVQCGMLLSLLLVSRFLGLSWRRHAFGIVLGLGILTSVDVVIYGVRTEFSSNVWVPYLNLVRTGTYLVCVSIWIGYLLAPELEPAPLAVVPDEEVETWNRELQHWLRD